MTDSRSIDLFSAAGEKKGTLSLPATLFSGEVNKGLMHQAMLLQQGNARRPIAHAKNRSEVRGSTRKLYQQKHTGRARRGSIRSPLLRGGGKAFGPRSEANFTRSMPKKMRHAALRSCLSFQLSRGAIVGLESYPDTIKTKDAAALLAKIPLKSARSVLFVLDGKHDALTLSVRNIPRVKAIDAAYLNPLDVLSSTAIVFLSDAVAKADALFGTAQDQSIRTQQRPTAAKKEKKPTTTKKTAAKKKSAAKKATSSASSDPVA